MLPSSPLHIWQAIFLATLFFLLQSFNVGPTEIGRSTRHSLQRWGHYGRPSVAERPAYITKTSALFGEGNRLYEAALQTHEVHNELHGYAMKVLRERITNGYSTKPSYMLSLIVNELTKPAEERTEWLVWMGPDIILLNPHIPLEVFLPPPDFDHIHFLGTHDNEGLNLGVYFVRVNQWSARMLIDVLSYPPDWLGDAAEKDEVAFEMVIAADGFRDHVQYQPRRWYNAYQLTSTQSEGKDGDVLVHFHDLEGDKWSAMAHTLERVNSPDNPWQVPLQATTYEAEIAAYWQRLRDSRDLLKQVDSELKNDNVLDKVRRLQYASTYEADDGPTIEDAIQTLSKALESSAKSS